MSNDPKLTEAIRIVRVVIEKLQMAGDAHLNISAIDALETVLAALAPAQPEKCGYAPTDAIGDARAARAEEEQP